jgi:hypothetical protein
VTSRPITLADVRKPGPRNNGGESISRRQSIASPNEVSSGVTDPELLLRGTRASGPRLDVNF